MKKQHKQMNPLRPLGKPVYIFIFPFLFTFVFFLCSDYGERYVQAPAPEWVYLLLIPLALLGMAIGYQLEMYLKEHLGKKAEMFAEVVLSAILIFGLLAEYQYVIFGLLAEYQYVLVPQIGAPPLNLHNILTVLRKKLPF